MEETAEIARFFLDELKKQHKNAGALVVALSGDLGAGKTAFTQAVGRELGVKSKVKSPTYVIMQKYLLKTKGYKFLFHLDAYRLKNEKELLHLGWKEIIADKNHIVFIEWPEMVSGAMPAHAKFIYITNDDSGNRNFKLN